MARPKGCKNKTGAEVKAQILAAYERIGGLKQFAAWASEHQGEFYRMYAALAPKEVLADVHVINESDLSDAELAAIATGSSQSAAQEADGPPESGGVH